MSFVIGLIFLLSPCSSWSINTIKDSTAIPELSNPASNTEARVETDSLKLNFETVIKEIFDKKKEEFRQMVLRNEKLRVSGSSISGDYIFDFNFEEEVKDYFLYYKKRPNVQPEITYDYKYKNEIEQLNLEVNYWISRGQKPDVYFVCVTVDEAMFWLNALDGKNLDYSNIIVSYLDLNLKKENYQIVSDVFKRHMNDFASFVNNFLTQHSSNSKGTFLYSWFTYNIVYKDNVALKDKSKFQNFYRLFYKKHANSTTDFRPKLTCINSLVETYSDNLLINYFKGYFAAIKKVVDGEYLCSNLDSFYVKLNPNFLVPIPQDSMREEIGQLADRFARSLETAYTNRPSPFKYNSGLQYHFVDIDNKLSENLKDQIFDDQCAYLREKSGMSFYIISGKSDFFMHPDLWNGFANLVKEKVNRDIINTDGLVLVTVPYRDVNIAFNEFSKQMPGVSFDPSTVDADKLAAVFPSLQYTSEVYKNTFKYCRKNTEIYKGFLCADGSRYFERKQFKLDEGVGLEFNSTILLLKNIYYDEIQNISKPTYNLYENDIEATENPFYEAQLASYKIRVASLLHQSQMSYDDPASWVEVKNNKNIVEKYIEVVMKDYLLNHAYFESFSSFFNDIGILFSNNGPDTEISDGDLNTYVNPGVKLETEHTYDNELVGVLDKVIYATIDVSGLIPVVGDFTDLIGVGYAAVRADEYQLKNYMIGLAIVGTSAIVVKGVRTLYICAKGRKYFQEGKTLVEITNDLIAKRTAVAEHLGVSVERLDNIGENLVNGLENGTFHSNQIINFRLLDEADQLDLLRSLDAEGSDIFQILRGKGHNNLELLADLTTNQQNRSLLSEVLSELSEDALIQLEKDLAADAGGALKVFFRESPKGVKAWEKMIKHLDLRKNVDFLDNIKDFSDDILAQLDADLLNTKYNLKDLFTESPADVKNIWKELKDNPKYHWERFDSDGFEAGSRWDKWSQREFFKDVTKKGKEFELAILNRMKNRAGAEYEKLKTLVSDLDDRYLISQMQFCLPGLSPPCKNQGEYFIADQVWIKYDVDGDIVDMVIVDSKLSKGTNFTPGQTLAKNNIGGTLNYKPFESITLDINDSPLPQQIFQGTSIKIEAFYKAYGDGNVNFINIE